MAENTYMKKFRDILWELSILRRHIDEFNDMNGAIYIDREGQSLMLRRGIEDVSNYFGYETEEILDGVKALHLFDIYLFEEEKK